MFNPKVYDFITGPLLLVLLPGKPFSGSHPFQSVQVIRFLPLKNNFRLSIPILSRNAFGKL